MRPKFSTVSLLALVLFQSIVFSQTNLIQNGSFERSMRTANPWAGIGASGVIKSPTEEANVLGGDGKIGQQTMPISVSVGDLNKDELPDLAVMDGDGFMRVYFNIGTKQEAKFGPAETSSLHLNPMPLDVDDAELKDKSKPESKPAAPKPTPRPATLKPGAVEPVVLTPKALHDFRSVQRINLADLSRTGKLDLLVGNYGGDVLFIPNTGAANRADFRTPASYESAVLQKSPERWGNVFAPYAVDWDKDGKVDLLVGEGSYSANSIHLFTGKGIGRPSMEPENRTVLAYGMGLEQLSPCVVDYNGDGNNDLLVAERSGKIAVYLGKGGPFKPDEPIPFNSFITLDGAVPVYPPNTPAAEPGATLDPLDAITATNLLSASGACTIATGDFNGDGLFDLVFGKRSGRVAIALNQGTATQPKFKEPVEVKVEDQEKPILLPSGWEADYGYSRGNFGGYITVVKNDPSNPTPGTPAVQPPEGTSYLEAGYLKRDFKFMPEPGIAKSKEDVQGMIKSPNFFSVKQDITKPLKVGKTYILTLKVKGSQVSNGRATILFRGLKKVGTGAIISKDDRGAVKRDYKEIREAISEHAPFAGGSNWTEVKKEFTVKFEAKDLADIPETNEVLVRLFFELAPGAGTVQFDDIKLIEK